MQLAARPRTTAGAKQVATHHLITAGVAVAGLIAVAPGVTPVLPRLQHDVQATAVRLTAGWDPLTAWQNAINTTSANASTIADNFFLAPGVGLQQAIVNEVGFLNEVLNDPSSIGTVLQKIATNAQTVASGLTGLNASAATTTAVNAHTLDGLHGAFLSLLPGFLPPDVDAAAVTQVLQVLSSPMSGLLIGAMGPVISPGVALLNSALAVGAALQASDPATALSDLLDVPADVVNSFFNGADLNLDALAPLIAQAGILPAGTTIDALDYAFGGLLTPGSVSQGTYTQDGNIDPIQTPGGSILNSLGLTVTTDALGVPLTLAIPSQAVGPLGALEGISQTVGVLLGDHWDGKGAVQTPPLSGLHFPTLSDTAEDPAEVNAATDDTADTDDTAATNDTAAVNTATERHRCGQHAFLDDHKTILKLTSPVKEIAAAENASASTELVGLPKPHVPATAPSTVPLGTTGSGAAATDASATGTGGAAVPVKGGSTSGKHGIANNPVRAAISNVRDGIKAISGGTAKRQRERREQQRHRQEQREREAAARAQAAAVATGGKCKSYRPLSSARSGGR